MAVSHTWDVLAVSSERPLSFCKRHLGHIVRPSKADAQAAAEALRGDLGLKPGELLTVAWTKARTDLKRLA